MNAMPFRSFGEPEVLLSEVMTTPKPRPDEVLVRVAAVSVGRLLDLLARSGNHPYAHFSFPHVLGAEHAGTVVALGSQVTTVSIGDRVAVFPVIVTGDDEQTRAGYPELSPSVELLGTHRQGAYAEYCSVPATNVRVVPDGMSPEDAVALVLAGAVAMNQFMRVGGVGEGTRIIVIGATSALGSTTALLARHLGANVIVTSRSAEKRDRLRALGFEHVLNASDEVFVEEVKRIFAGRGAHVVVDNIGLADIWQRDQQCLAPGGAIVSSGAFLGLEAPVNLKTLYSFGHRIIGVRTGNLASLDRLWAEVDRGFRSVVDRTFMITDAPSAHHYIEAGENVGRVLLDLNP
jgi:NADPH:quinone reductase-like Zn-dependent oxidoreductase